MRYLIAVLILCLAIPCFAVRNEKYSQKDFTGLSFKHLDASEFSNTEIIGSCFYQPNYTGDPVWIDIFPDGTVNVTFTASNLDNVLLPEDSVLNGDLNCHRQFIIVDGADSEVTE